MTNCYNGEVRVNVVSEDDGMVGVMAEEGRPLIRENLKNLLE